VEGWLCANIVHIAIRRMYGLSLHKRVGLVLDINGGFLNRTSFATESPLRCLPPTRLPPARVTAAPLGGCEQRLAWGLLLHGLLVGHVQQVQAEAAQSRSPVIGEEGAAGVRGVRGDLGGGEGGARVD